MRLGVQINKWKYRPIVRLTHSHCACASGSLHSALHAAFTRHMAAKSQSAMNRGRSGWANAALSPQWDLNLTSSILYSKCIVLNLVSYSTTREQEKLLRKGPSPILERWWWKLLMGWMWKAEMQRAGRQWDSSNSRADSISVSSLDSNLWFHKWLTQTRHPPKLRVRQWCGHRMFRKGNCCSGPYSHLG